MKRRWRATSRRRSMPIISSMDREEIDEMIPSRRLSVLVRAVDHIGEEREVQTTPLGREVLEMHKSSLAKAALRSRQSSLSKRRRMMKTAIRSAIALAGALLVVSGVPIRAQSSVEDRSPDATRPSPSQDFYCGARKLGTWFYCDKPKPRPNPNRSEERRVGKGGVSTVRNRG